METFEKLVLPISEQSIDLLKNVVFITDFILFSYIGILFGSLVFSQIYLRLAKTKKTGYYTHLAKYFIDMPTGSKSLFFVFGLIPLLVKLFGSLQLFPNVASDLTWLFLITIIVLICSVMLTYTFKHSFHINSIISFTGNDTENNDESDLYKNKTNELLTKSGRYSLIFMLLTIYMILLNQQILTGNIDSVVWPFSFFSIKVLIGVFGFIILSLALAASLYIYLTRNNEKNQDVQETRTYFLYFIIVSLLFNALILVFSIVFLSNHTISFAFIISLLVTLLLSFILCIKYYIALKNNSINNLAGNFILFIILMGIFVAKDHNQMNINSKYHTAYKIYNYSVWESETKKNAGLITGIMTGEEIFKAKCSACHTFEKQLVGPAYKTVLPKYAGNKEKLIAFISNPVKINPALPVMPPQGLKPEEVKNIAEYLLSTYKK